MNLFETILNTLPEAVVQEYLKKGYLIKRTYGKGDVLHFEGDPCQQVELVLTGEFVIERIGEAGDLMTINYLKFGNIIGANLIFSSTEFYPMTISAKKKSEAIIITKDILFELCQKYPRFLMAFIQVISDMSMFIVNKMKHRVSRTIRQSIIHFLKQQYAEQNNFEIQLKRSKKSIAESFGVSRTSLSRELQYMKNDGIIDFTSKTITIIDPSILID